MSRKTAELATAPVGRLVLRFSIPSIAGMLANGLSLVLDRIFVGRGVGPDALAGVAILFPLVLFVQSFSMLIAHGAASVISLRLGEGKRDRAEAVVGTATTFGLALGVAIVLFVGVFMRPLLTFFGGSGIVLDYAVRFTTVLLPGLFLQVLSFVLNNMIRGQGDPVTALVTMVVSVVVNGILNPIFIFGLGLGVAGSALATDLANAVVVCWLLLVYCRTGHGLRLRWSAMRPDRHVAADILRTGSASAFTQFANGITITIVTRLIASYAGDAGITVLGIASSIVMVMLMPIIGIRQGVQPILGYNFGAGAYARTRAALRICLAATVAVCTVAYAGFYVFSREIVDLFVHGSPAVLALGVPSLRWYLVSIPVVGVAIVGSVYFQAVGKGGSALLVTLVRQLIVLIPLYLVLPRLYGIAGIWLAGPLADLASVFLTIVLLAREMRSLSSLERGADRQPSEARRLHFVSPRM